MTPTPPYPNVVITGGAGYVGSVLAPHLIRHGYSVTVVDLFLYGEDLFGDGSESDQLRLVKADIRDKEALREAFAGHDAILHLACVSNDPSFDLDPALGRAVNYDSFDGVLWAARESGAKRFVYASSSSVYGVSDEPNVREDSPCDPLTDYSRYKLLCEQALSETDMGECDWTVLRPATVCGYAPRVRLDVIVNILTISALARKKITVFGGSQLRPNINILDMAEAYRIVLESDSSKVANEIFNAGYENRSVSDLAELVFDAVGDPEVEIDVQPTNDPRSYHVDSSKITETLGFAPSHTIRDAVVSICDAYRSGEIPDALTDSRYYNIKRMQEVKISA